MPYIRCSENEIITSCTPANTGSEIQHARVPSGAVDRWGLGGSDRMAPCAGAFGPKNPSGHMGHVGNVTLVQMSRFCRRVNSRHAGGGVCVTPRSKRYCTHFWQNLPHKEPASYRAIALQRRRNECIFKRKSNNLIKKERMS